MNQHIERVVDKENIPLLEGMLSTAAVYLDLLKIEATFWDRLVILDGATLALSLTAVTAFKGLHIRPHDGGIGYLLAAWKGLISSAVLGYGAQWFLAVAIGHFNTGLFSLRSMILTARMNPSDPEIQTELQAFTKDGGLADRYHTISYVSGIAAATVTIVAFIYLFKYLSVNLR